MCWRRELVMKHLSFVLATLGFVMFFTGAATAAEPKKIGDIYATEITAVMVNDEEKVVEESVPATLLIEYAGQKDDKPNISFHFKPPKEPILYKVSGDQLPPGFAGIFNNTSSYFFTPSPQRSGWDTREQISLTDAAKKADSKEEDGQTLTIYDAHGDPAEEFIVEITASHYPGNTEIRQQYTILTKTLDNTGIITIPAFHTAGVSNTPHSHSSHHNIRNLQMTVYHPRNGQYMNFNVPLYTFHNGKRIKLKELCLPMVPETFEDQIPDEPNVFIGQIFDHTKNPVAEISIKALWLNIEGGRLLLQQNYTLTVALPDDGRFEYAVPRELLKEKTGQECMPGNASASIIISPIHPSRHDISKISRNIYAGKNNRILLPYSERLTFRFKDGEGNIIHDPFEDYRTSRLTMIRKGNENSQGVSHPEPSLSLGIEQQEDGTLLTDAVPLPGTYKVRFKDRLYHPQKLEVGASENVIIWEPVQDQYIYSGRVVDIRTGEPVPGAYLSLSSESKAPWIHATMSDFDRKQLWQEVPVDGTSYFIDEHHITLNDGRTWFGIVALGRTDEDGRYRIAHPPGQKPVGLNVWAPGMIGIKAWTWSFLRGTNAGKKKIELPDAVLIPAAEVTVTALAPIDLPDEYLREDISNDPESLSLTTSVTFDSNRNWKISPPLLNPRVKNPWELVHNRGWNKVDTPYKVIVPADVRFSIFAHNTGEPTIHGALWKNIAPLSQGETLELDPKEISLNRPYIIKVVHADGTPAVGKSVRIDGQLPLVTDDAGTVIGWTAGHVRRIEVMSGEGWNVLAKKESIDVPENDPHFTVEIRVPGEN